MTFARTSTRRTVLTAAAALVAAGAIGTVLTLTVGTSTSTTPLDDPAPVSAAGTPTTASLPAEIVAGRILSRYHPLPWVGESLDDVTCDAPLLATVGSRTTCTGTSASQTIDIPVRVTASDATSVTWSFER